jgi:hypothetical protein
VEIRRVKYVHYVGEKKKRNFARTFHVLSNLPNIHYWGVHENLLREYELCETPQSERQAIHRGLNIFVSTVPTFAIDSRLKYLELCELT